MAKHEAIPAGTATQVAHPGRATLRTVAAWVAAFVVFAIPAIPLLIEHLGPYLPESWVAWLTGALGVLTALVALFTRLMALPQAQPFLELLGLGTGVEKEPAPPTEPAEPAKFAWDRDLPPEPSPDEMGG